MGTITFRGKQYNTAKVSATTEGYKESINVNEIDDSSSDKQIDKCIAIKVSGIYYLITGSKKESGNMDIRVVNKHILAKSEIVQDTYLDRINNLPADRNYNHQYKQHDGRLNSTFSQRRSYV